LDGIEEIFSWNYPSRAVRVFRLLARCHSLPPVAASLTPAARGRRTQLGPHGRRPTGHSPDKAAASRVPAVVLEDGPASPVHVDVRGPRFELSRRKLGRASRHGTARILCGTRVYVLRRAARHRHKFEGSAWYSLSLYARCVQPFKIKQLAVAVAAAVLFLPTHINASSTTATSKGCKRVTLKISPYYGY
jgi:hypothetical protein